MNAGIFWIASSLRSSQRRLNQRFLNIFLRQAVRQGKIPFEISLNKPPNVPDIGARIQGQYTIMCRICMSVVI